MSTYNIDGQYVPIPQVPIETLPSVQMAQFDIEMAAAPTDRYHVRPGGVAGQNQAEAQDWVFYSRFMVSYTVLAVSGPAALIFRQRNIGGLAASEWCDWLPIYLPGSNYRSVGCSIELGSLLGGFDIVNNHSDPNHVIGMILVRGL